MSSKKAKKMLSKKWKVSVEKLNRNSAYGKKKLAPPQVAPQVAWDCKECGTRVDPLRGHDADSCQQAKDYSKVGHCAPCAGRRSQDMCTCSCATCHPEFFQGHPLYTPQAAAPQGPGIPQGFRKRSILERLGSLGETPFFEFLAASFKREHGETGELTHGLEKLSDVELTTLSKAIQSVKETWDLEACRKLRRDLDEARSIEKVSEEEFRSRQDETTLKFVEGLELRNVELEESLLFLTLKVLKAQKKKEETPPLPSYPTDALPRHWSQKQWDTYRLRIEMQERYRIGAAVKAHALSPKRPAEGSSEALIHVAQMIEKNELK